MLRLGSTKTMSTLSLLNTGVGFVMTSSRAPLTSIGIIITNVYTSNLKIRYTKLRDLLNIFDPLYEKPLKQSTVDKEIDDKEAQEKKDV